ncbi:hypothetical protein GCM10027613_44320 [Microlunatus endophyticus]
MVAYRKKSYHSITDPITLARTVVRIEPGLRPAASLLIIVDPGSLDVPHYGTLSHGVDDCSMDGTEDQEVR